MNSESFKMSLKLILQGVSDAACFELMSEALDKQEFLFVKEFCDPSWTFGASKPNYTSDFVTALLFAQMQDYHCDLAPVRFLCDNFNIDVNSVSVTSHSLLDVALAYCDPEVAKYLVKLGANPTLKTGMKEGKYHYVLRTAPKGNLIEIFDYMFTLGIEVDYDALPYAVFHIGEDSAEIISWIVEHGHGEYAGDTPFHAEEYLLRDVVVSAIRKEGFRSSVWLDKIDALLRTGGIVANPVVENDYGRPMRLIEYVKLQAKNYPDTAKKVLKILKKYD